jgi:hypothetical protein
MSKITKYGPGDPETWGPCTGDPNDPRSPDAGDQEEWEEAQAQSEQAERKFKDRFITPYWRLAQLRKEKGLPFYCRHPERCNGSCREEFACNE